MFFPELWLSWLRDEIKLVSSEAERKKVIQLFERAVKDYLGKICKVLKSKTHLKILFF
jgi:hypothetical protein